MWPSLLGPFPLRFLSYPVLHLCSQHSKSRQLLSSTISTGNFQCSIRLKSPVKATSTLGQRTCLSPLFYHFPQTLFLILIPTHWSLRLIWHLVYFYFFFNFFFFLFFWDRVSLCSPGCPGTHFVDQAGLKLELRNPPASAPQVLGLKACTTTTRLFLLHSFPFQPTAKSPFWGS